MKGSPSPAVHTTRDPKRPYPKPVGKEQSHLETSRSLKCREGRLNEVPADRLLHLWAGPQLGSPPWTQGTELRRDLPAKKRDKVADLQSSASKPAPFVRESSRVARFRVSSLGRAARITGVASSLSVARYSASTPPIRDGWVFQPATIASGEAMFNPKAQA